MLLPPSLKVLPVPAYAHGLAGLAGYLRVSGPAYVDGFCPSRRPTRHTRSARDADPQTTPRTRFPMASRRRFTLAAAFDSFSPSW